MDSLIGRIVKIRPECKHFIGGTAIPDWVRKGSYISRINPNGSITLSSLKNLIEIDSLFREDIILTNKTRAPKDTVKPIFPKIDIRIMGVPSRIENIRQNQKRLKIPDENIFIDEERKGCVWNAKRAWLKETDKEYVLVLQDDVELCNDFTTYLNKIVDTHPFPCISLYCPYFTYMQKFAPDMCNKSPYITTPSISGQGLLMRTELVKDCIDNWVESCKGDDANIQLYFVRRGVRFLTTIPFIIQHIGDHSVFDPARSMGRSEYYNSDPKDVDWDNGFTNNFNNFVRGKGL